MEKRSRKEGDESRDAKLGSEGAAVGLVRTEGPA